MRLKNLSGPVRHGAFRRLVCAHALSRFGTELALVSVAFAVLRTAHSASALGLVLAARTLPNVVFLVLGGVWADRLPRARVMISSDLICAVVQTALAAAVLLSASPLWLMMLLQATLGTAGAFFAPAATGLTPATVPDAELQRANALLGLVGNGAGMLGPALAGVLVALAGPGWSLLIDAVTFLGSALLLVPQAVAARRASEPSGPSHRPRAMVAELAEGWQEVRTRPWLLAGIGLGLIFQACFAIFFTLGPVTARLYLGGAGAWGAMVTAFGAGSLLGGLLSLRVSPRRPLLAMLAALLVTTPVMVTLSLTGRLPVLLVATGLAGLGFAAADAFWETALQRAVPAERLGRVAAFDRIGSSCLRPFGYLLAGSAAAVLGLPATLRAASAVLAVSVLAVALLVPSMRRLAQRPPGGSGATEPVLAAAG